MHAFAHAWEGEVPEGLEVRLLNAPGLTNHVRLLSFSRSLAGELASSGYDALMGFNKMPGLDLYFAADPCFASTVRSKPLWYRLTPRCRAYLQLEKAVFEKGAKTDILLLSPREKAAFQRYYGTEEDRFHLLPPGISRDRLAPPNAAEIREAVREGLSIEPDRFVLLMVGSGFKTKGVDRAIRAMASLPRAVRTGALLLIAGNGKPGAFRRLAGRLGLSNQVRFLGGRDDIPGLMAAADLLIHPAYRENTGTVLIEAMAAGLPVLATGVCGYAHHVEQAGAGELVPSPYRQAELNRLLASMLDSETLRRYSAQGKEYVEKTDVFSLPEKAVDILERVAS